VSNIVLIQLNKPLKNHTQDWNATLLVEVQLAIPNAYSSPLMRNYISPGRVRPGRRDTWNL